MSAKGRKRKRRGADYQPPPRRGAVVSERQEEQPLSSEVPRARSGRARVRPPAPWGSFPLVELIVLLGLVMLIVGFFVSGTRGITMIAAGITLASLAGLELSVREHFAGYRSHTTVLAGAVTVLVLAIGFFAFQTAWLRGIGLLVGALVFATAFYAFREAFKRRSGGLGFR